MKNNKIASSAMFLVGLISYLLLAYGLDRISGNLLFFSNSLRQSPSFRSVSFLPLFYPLAILLVVPFPLLGFLFMKDRLHNDKRIGIFYLVVGMLIIFAYNLSLTGLFPGYVRGTFTPTHEMVQEFLSPTSYLYVAGSLVTAIGLLLLTPKKDE